METVGQIHNVVGVLGVVIVLASYFLLQRGTLTLRDWRYSGFNLLGSAMILWSLMIDFNLPAFFIEVCWIIISIYGIYQSIAARAAEQ